MKARLLVTAALVLISGTVLHAQKVRGIFSLTDYLTSNSYIGHAGRQYLKPVPPKESTFFPKAFDPQLPQRDISADYDFVLDLLDRGLREDALVLLGEGNYAPSDSLNLLRGLALFDDRQFEVAHTWLGAACGPVREQAMFFNTVAGLHIGITSADELASYSGDYQELAELQKAGLALADSDIPAFRSRQALFTYADYRLAESETALEDLAGAVEKSLGKRPFVAAALSAVVPGAGKIYAGKTGEGVASLLAVGSLAAITAEQWKKNGPKDWRTILSGSLCAAFYLGNIYGSWISVEIHRQEVQDEAKALLIYHLTVPLHGFFR